MRIVVTRTRDRTVEREGISKEVIILREMINSEDQGESLDGNVVKIQSREVGCAGPWHLDGRPELEGALSPGHLSYLRQEQLQGLKDCWTWLTPVHWEGRTT